MNDMYIFTFNTSSGRTRQLRVSNPDTSLNQVALNIAANQIISSGMLAVANGGAITSLRKLDLQTVTRDILI
jgi:hypothetical protein